MNTKNWIPSEQIVQYQEDLKVKGHNRNLIDDTIYQLNKIKPTIQALNLELIQCEWKDLEKIKKLKQIAKLKTTFLRQLIYQVRQDSHYKMDYQWCSTKNKMTFIFSRDWVTCHISHVQSKSLIYLSNDITLLKDIVSHISDNKIRNILFLTIKERLWKEI